MKKFSLSLLLYSLATLVACAGAILGLLLADRLRTVSMDRSVRDTLVRMGVPERDLERVAADIYTFTGRFMQSYSTEVLGDWLMGRNAHLQGRPIDFLVAGELDQVMEALQAETEGAFS